MEKRMEKTDYKITEFHNSEFGSIRMIEDGGRLLFSGIDVAFALGYAKPRNAINVHCKGALKRGVLTSGGVQPMIFIPEGDVYRLITKSRLKSAQNFEKWVFDEVLPAIRKTGGYLETDLLDRVKDNPELLLEFAERLLAENNRNRELQNRVKDMQPQFATMLATAKGTSYIIESVWDNRFKYAEQLRRMGADIMVDGKTEIINGIGALTGAPVEADDLRAGAAMVIAGMMASGVTTVSNINFIDRGYENLVEKLTSVGADIKRENFEEE